MRSFLTPAFHVIAKMSLSSVLPLLALTGAFPPRLLKIEASWPKLNKNGKFWVLRSMNMPRCFAINFLSRTAAPIWVHLFSLAAELSKAGWHCSV
jgi:hypothetical protein